MKKNDQVVNYLILWVLISIVIITQFHNLRYLIWNLGLAFIPYIASLVIADKKIKNVIKGVALPIWLFFYPNAIYLTTDAIHLSNYEFYSVYQSVQYNMSIELWVTFILIMTAIIMGIILSFLSFSNIASFFKLKNVGKVVFLIVLSLLTGFAVYIGRFLRFNSWDIISNLTGILGFLKNGLNANSVILILLFSGFHFIIMYMFELINTRSR